MEITKELKEKLLKANSEEEVKALLGDAVKEEEAAAIRKEIEALKAAAGLEKVDDDELEAVNAGADRDYLKDGCLSSTNDSWCWISDYCIDLWTEYSNYDPCPKGGNHAWKAKGIPDGVRLKKIYICQKCKAEKEANYTTDRWLNG